MEKVIYNYLKKASLLLVLFLLCIAACQAQQPKPAIFILNKGPHIKSKEVKFRITSTGTLYYYVGLEKLLNGRWQEIMLDISSEAPDRAAIINKISSHQLAIKSFLVKNIPADYRKNGNAFRLKVTYGSQPRPSTVQKTVTSVTFYIP